jgi:nucleotide-binding universal stress UspA family protein
LFHVLTGSEASPFGFTEYLGNHELRWVEEIKKRIREDELAIESAMGEARERLVKAGFEPRKIDLKVVRGGGKQAGAIAEEAQKGEYDTIVVGRRGLSRVQEFIMGRVSNKVINLAKDKTVWVVG